MQSAFDSRLVQLRSSVLVWLTHRMGMPYFKLVRKPLHFPYDMQALSTLPHNTVGYHLYQFLHQHQLHLLPFYEKHDIKHVLLDYPPTDCGEVCLQSFMLANGRVTLPVIATVMYGLFTMPEHWKRMFQAFLRGYRNPNLQAIDWIGILDQDYHHTKSQLIKSSYHGN